MSPEQHMRLEALLPGIAETVLAELDPATWPGAGKLPNQMSRDERGDRAWAKKNALASLSLLENVYALLHPRAAAPSEDEATGPLTAEELRERTDAAERQATEILERARKRENH